MENNLVLLLYGDRLPPEAHINKIAKYYGKHYQKDRVKECFNENDYFEVRIEERYTGLDGRQEYIPIGVSVRKEYFSKFLKIFKSLKGNHCLCKLNHEHPNAIISGKHFEGSCYYLKDVEKKIMFVEEFTYEKNEDSNGANFIDFFEQECDDVGYDADDIDIDFYKTVLNKFQETAGPKNEWFSVVELDWYKKMPNAKRWKIADANENTGKVFEQWLNSLIDQK
ncbi:hypothetical protein [Paenisporosarcina indica]|uniref:hypothetical protein n=1 Tax=Paenisporosarcina indica TaxID=650093 RepID=UPI0009502FAF|nr:hypothetical protein [Paenisporosarcina indica]